MLHAALKIGVNICAGGDSGGTVLPRVVGGVVGGVVVVEVVEVVEVGLCMDKRGRGRSWL